MEAEEKKTKKTTGTRRTGTSKKEVTTKKADTAVKKATTKKTSTSKQATAKKEASSKEVTSAKKATTKKVEATPKKATTKKVKSEQVLPEKNIEVQKISDVEENEEIKQKEEVREKQQQKSKNNKKQENKNNKRYVDISLGAILCAIVIVALIILNVKLGKHAYGILKNESTNSNVQSENNVSVTQEIGNVLNKDNELVEKMKGKITYPSNVLASIYNTQGFNTNTISNELKLTLGWANADDGKKLKAINEKNEDVEALEKQVMEESIKIALGPNVKYTDESFKYNKITTFSDSSRIKEKIIFEEGLYSIILEEEEETISPLIYQEIQKVVKYSENLVVYVKTAFIDTNGEDYQIYKNLKNGNLSDELLQIGANELFEGVPYDKYTGKGAVTVEENSALDTIRAKLNTYKYTFTFDETMQEYYLSEFSRENA